MSNTVELKHGQLYKYTFANEPQCGWYNSDDNTFRNGPFTTSAIMATNIVKLVPEVSDETV